MFFKGLEITEVSYTDCMIKELFNLLTWTFTHFFFTSSEVFQLIMWITTKSSGARWWWKMMMLYHKYLKNFSINIHEILIYQTSSLDSLCGDDWVSQLWTRWGISTFHVSTDSVVQPQHVLTTKLATWYAKSTSFFVSKIKNREI